MRELDTRRIKQLNNLNYASGGVVYWMQRDRRCNDNWALVHAQNLAIKFKAPLTIFYSLNGNFSNANVRQYGFMLEGLVDTIEDLKKYEIPFHLRRGSINSSIKKYISEINAGYLVTDFSPLRVYKKRVARLAKEIKIPFELVDAHNIIPTWYLSDKQEFAAHTIRRKIHLLLEEFLHPIPRIISHPFIEKGTHEFFDPKALLGGLKVDTSVQEINWLVPSEENGNKILKSFINDRFDSSGELRNNPNKDNLSNLSPYIHFGQISAQNIAIKINEMEQSEGRDAFLEQLIVRRELAENFCYYNNDYDSFNGFHDWAKKTLNEHREDERDYIYSPSEFENAKTHDDLWNAAQYEMVDKGKMHGFMRMYWAKKILEWTPNPETALQIAIDLNDKYELDGRDPNGYTGIAWSIGGIHDRPWFERPIFGKVRYMNYNGCKRKFNVNNYIKNNAHNAQLSI
tara:strand:+ start:2250 stop:3617 length:1368 start_codon:yes stop_codon:yes gene_type:complete